MMEWIILGLIMAVVFIAVDVHSRLRFRRLARARSGESICQFARSFSRREVEPAVIRACWEAFQALAPVTDFPVHASDGIKSLYGLDGDDLDDLFLALADRTGRSIRWTEANPFYNQVDSVGQLARFLNAQPKRLLGALPVSA